MSWLLLIAAGVIEVAWALSLKPTQGFTRLGPTVVSLILMMVAVYLLTLAVRNLPIGTAYAVFTGIGALGTVLFGIIVAGDPPTRNGEVGGRLGKVQSPLAACANAPSSSGCAKVFRDLRNPYYLGDEVGFTQTLGWVDAWTSRPSVYAVAAAEHRRRGRRGRLRPREQFTTRCEGRRSRLSGHVQFCGLVVDLDAKHERRDLARRVRRSWARGTARAAAGCHDRGRRNMGAGLRRRDHEGRPLRAGRWVHDRGRCGSSPKRRLRELSGTREREGGSPDQGGDSLIYTAGWRWRPTEALPL